jgi:hypothetical protein
MEAYSQGPGRGSSEHQMCSNYALTTLCGFMQARVSE